MGGGKLSQTFANPCGHDAGFWNVDLVHHHPGIRASGIARDAIHRRDDSRLSLDRRRGEVLKIEATQLFGRLTHPMKQRLGVSEGVPPRNSHETV